MNQGSLRNHYPVAAASHKSRLVGKHAEGITPGVGVPGFEEEADLFPDAPKPTLERQLSAAITVSLDRPVIALATVSITFFTSSSETNVSSKTLKRTCT